MLPFTDFTIITYESEFSIWHAETYVYNFLLESGQGNVAQNYHNFLYYVFFNINSEVLVSGTHSFHSWASAKIVQTSINGAFKVIVLK